MLPRRVEGIWLIVKDVRQSPVAQKGTLVGMLRRREMMRWLQRHSGQSQSTL
ncbi:MAG TPA: hypothetical protein VFD70_12395 [Anaerolineae bacterium]|nr:hypothetical protein [Anaerolineae bacterium]